jgi:hypothetical protein
MTVFVREYSWMWDDLQLSLAECRVYAYIYGLSHGEKKGYNGSKRGLAKTLGLSEACVRDTLNALEEKSLISYTNGLWQSESRAIKDNAQSVRESAQSVRESAQSVRSPHTPLYIDNNNKKQASMQTLFEKFWKLYEPAPEFQNRYAATKFAFEQRSEVAQRAMIESLEEHPGMKGSPNPYFFVVDFPEPQPQFLRGDEGGDIVQVKYKGQFKLCYRATMEMFGLEKVRDW